MNIHEICNLCWMLLQFNYKSLPGICSIEQWFDCKCYNVRKALLHSTFKIYWNFISPSSIQVCHSYQIFQNNHIQSIRELNISSEFTIFRIISTSTFYTICILEIWDRSIMNYDLVKSDRDKVRFWEKPENDAVLNGTLHYCKTG